MFVCARVMFACDITSTEWFILAKWLLFLSHHPTLEPTDVPSHLATRIKLSPYVRVLI